MNIDTETVRNGKDKIRQAMGVPSSVEPSTSSYGSVIILVGVLALTIKFCDCYGIFYSLLPAASKWPWFPGLVAAAPMAIVFIGLIMGWIRVSIDKNVWFRPLVWASVIVGYLFYGAVSTNMEGFFSSLMQGSPIPEVHLYSMASFLTWLVFGMLTLIAATFIGYRKISVISAKFIKWIIVAVLIVMLVNGFMTTLSRVFIDPLPPEFVDAMGSAAADQLSAPNSSFGLTQNFQQFMATRTGQSLSLLSSLFISWVTLAIGLKGMRVR